MAHNNENYRKLLEIAKAQQGLFTTKQAKEAGYSEKNHSYHIHAGSWIRLHRGIYRLANFPAQEEPDLVLWALWSQNRSGQVQGVYSHQTSLRIHNLSDLNPAKLHMTVPVRFRRNSSIPKALALHFANLPTQDIDQVGSYRVVRPMRAILDLLAEGSAPEEVLAQSLHEGLRLGLITLREVEAAELPANLKQARNRFVHGVKLGKAA